MFYSERSAVEMLKRLAFSGAVAVMFLLFISSFAVGQSQSEWTRVGRSYQHQNGTAPGGTRILVYRYSTWKNNKTGQIQHQKDPNWVKYHGGNHPELEYMAITAVHSDNRDLLVVHIYWRKKGDSQWVWLTTYEQ